MRTRARLFSRENAHGNDSEALRTCWNAQGSLVASGGCDGNLCIYSNKLELKYQIRYGDNVDVEDRAVYALWFQPGNNNNEALYAGYDDTICVWDVETGNKTWAHSFDRVNELVSQRNLLGKQLVFDCCGGMNGNTLLTALSNGSIALVDVRSPSAAEVCCMVPLAHKLAVTSVTQSTTTQHKFASASVDGTVKIWDARKLIHGPVFTSPSRNKVIYGAQFVTTATNGKECVMAWAGQSLEFYTDDDDKPARRAVHLGFPVLCAQERNGMFAACGDVQQPSRNSINNSASKREKCCPEAATGMYFGNFL